MDFTNLNVEISSDVKSTANNDGVVLLDLRKGVYYTFNGIGGKIWTNLQERLPPLAIVDNLAENFGRPHEQVRADVERFLHSLAEKGLVQLNAK